MLSRPLGRGSGRAGALLAPALAACAVLATGCGEDDAPTASVDRTITTGALPATRITEVAQAARAAGCTLRLRPSEGRAHTTRDVEYATNPPTSGPHAPEPAADGAYAQAPRTEALVHALEHGRVVLQFRPDADATLRARLKTLYNEDRRHVILTPNTTGMPYAVAATAWRRLLGCREVNDRVYDALRAFRERYRDRAPERVP